MLGVPQHRQCWDTVLRGTVLSGPQSGGSRSGPFPGQQVMLQEKAMWQV